MPRNISFALTTPQFLDGSKDVTRRNGWANVRAGDILCAVEKSQGLGKGGKIKRLGFIRVKDARREPLNTICADLAYGSKEMIREGFPPPHRNSDPAMFLEFFCDTHRGVEGDTVITRIEFERVPLTSTERPTSCS